MITTGRYGFRVPEKSDPPRGWEQLLALAEDIEAALATVDDRASKTAAGLAALQRQANAFANSFETETATLSFTNQDHHSVPITFARPFDKRPVVFTNIHSGAGPTARWHSRAYDVTKEGFRLFVFASDGGRTATWDDVPVAWVAIDHD